MAVEFLVFLVCTTIFAGLLCLISAFATFKVNSNLDKFNLYECGFKAFENTARNPLMVDFYLVVLLFIIFDIETIILFPWLLNFYTLSYDSLWLVYSFIGLLVVGYLYEIKLGLFDWVNTK